MLEIKPMQDKSVQQYLCSLCGTEYKEKYFAYEAKVDGNYVGICQFAIRGSYGYLDGIFPAKDTSDGEALFILGRAVLNFIDLAGAHEAYFEGEDTPLVRAVGFAPKDGRLYMNLSAFFDNPCKNKK